MSDKPSKTIRQCWLYVGNAIATCIHFQSYGERIVCEHPNVKSKDITKTPRGKAPSWCPLEDAE